MKVMQSWRFVDAVARTGSIRKAAETLSITSTALNRRILAIENELGVPIFERLARGVRLSAAGELLIQHIRGQLSDLERVKSQIADLAGERRGGVAIACSQALLPYFLPEQITHYRTQHPGVNFSVFLRDRVAAEKALVDMSADLVIVYEPVLMQDFEVLQTVRQEIHVMMSAGHPLARRQVPRLRECLTYPLALPNSTIGVRALLENAARRVSMPMQTVVESDSFEFLRHQVLSEDILSFQIPIGIPPERLGSDVVSRPVDPRDLPPGRLFLGQLRGRVLPVAAASFARQIQETFASRFECE